MSLKNSPIQLPFTADVSETPLWETRSYAHWASEETLEKIEKLLQKKFDVSDRELKNLVKEMSGTHQSNRKTTEMFDKTVSKMANDQNSLTASIQKRQKTEDEFDRRIDESSKGMGIFSRSMDILNNNVKFTDETMTGLNQALMGASGIIGRLAGDFSGLYFNISRMSGPITGAVAGSVAALFGQALIGLQTEAEMYERGLTRMRVLREREEGQLIESQATYSEFVANMGKFNVSINEFSEFFGDSVVGMRTMELTELSKAMEAARANMYEMGFQSRDVAEITKNILQQRTRMGIFERMDAQRLSNSVISAAENTSYFAQQLGKSREEIAKSAEEFITSTEAQYVMLTRFGGDETAMTNYKAFASAISGMDESIQSDLRELLTADVMEATDAYKKMLGLGEGGQQILRFMEEFRGNMATREMTPEQVSEMINRGFANMEQPLAGTFAQFGVLANNMREFIIQSARSRGILSQSDMIGLDATGRDMPNQAQVVRENLDAISSAITQLTNAISTSDETRNLLVKNLELYGPRVTDALTDIAEKLPELIDTLVKIGLVMGSLYLATKALTAIMLVGRGAKRTLDWIRGTGSDRDGRDRNRDGGNRNRGGRDRNRGGGRNAGRASRLGRVGSLLGVAARVGTGIGLAMMPSTMGDATLSDEEILANMDTDHVRDLIAQKEQEVEQLSDQIRSTPRTRMGTLSIENRDRVSEIRNQKQELQREIDDLNRAYEEIRQLQADQRAENGERTQEEAMRDVLSILQERAQETTNPERQRNLEVAISRAVASLERIERNTSRSSFTE